MDFKIQTGQRLAGGFPGKELDEEFIRLVKEYKIGNVILFEHNMESMSQLKKLCREIQKLIKKETGHSAFITIDQEGGSITRLPSDGCNVPGAMATAATGDVKNAEILAEITAKELRSAGVNFNLAPDMDVNSNPQNPVIGVRSYSDCPKAVAEYGISAVNGYRNGNILSCAKHFPGHGDTAVDSHLGLPVINKSLEELEQLELIPFREAIKNKIPAIMTSHILFPRLEQEKIPCTMSRRIITDILKKKMGFEGLILSDSMEMDAIKKYYGTAQGVAAAINAGVDIVFVSHTASLIEESVNAVYQAAAEGKLSLDEMQKSAEKIIYYKKQYIECCQSAKNEVFPNPCTEEDKKLALEIRRKSIVLTQGRLFKPGSHPFFTGCPGFRATLASSVENKPIAFAEYMKDQFGGKAVVSSKNPDKKEIQDTVAAAGGADSIIVSTYNGHLQKGQMELVRALSEMEIPTVVVALRNPYDLASLPKGVTGIAAWDNSVMTLAVLSEMFRGQWRPSGTLPVQL